MKSDYWSHIASRGIFKNAAILTILLAGSACANSDTMNKADLRSVYLSERGGLIVDFDYQNIRCQRTILTIQNQTTKRLFDIEFTPNVWKSDLRYAITSLPPADYKMYKAGCSFGSNAGGYSDKKFNGISVAYTSFKIEPGKVLYPGTLKITKASNSKNIFFSVVDREEEVRSELAEVYPKLEPKFEKNLIKSTSLLNLEKLLNFRMDKLKD